MSSSTSPFSSPDSGAGREGLGGGTRAARRDSEISEDTPPARSYDSSEISEDTTPAKSYDYSEILEDTPPAKSYGSEISEDQATPWQLPGHSDKVRAHQHHPQRALWPTTEAAAAAAAAGSAGAAPPPNSILSLPDEALVGILRGVSAQRGDLSFASTCHKFSALANEAVSSVTLKPGKLLSEDSLLRSLAAYDGITAISLGKESLDRITDTLLHFVALRPALSALELVFTRDCSASNGALAQVLRCCRGLKRLSLEGWAKGCVPDLFQHQSQLQHLCLELPCNVLPESLGSVPALRSLKVSRRYGRNIKVPDSLTRLRQLQELSIDCWDLSGAQEGISSLTALTSLHLTLRFPYQLPWSLEGLARLKRLALNCRYLEVLPDGMTRLESLESITLVCPFLRNLPERVSRLQRLKTLEVSVRGCLRLPEDLWELEALEELKLKCRHLVPTSPWGFTRMPRLQSLSVKCAAVAPSTDHVATEGLHTMFGGHFGSLSSSLTSLSLRSERMDCLPENCRELRVLRRLTIGADEPDYVWEPMRKLRPRECLKGLPQSVALISGLEELHIVRCSRLWRLPDNLGCLLRLKILALRDCPRLEGLPTSAGKLTSLEELDIEACGVKRFRFTLPDCFDNLESLRVARVSCSKLKAFPQSLLRLTSLESLTIGCAASELPDAFQASGQLRELLIVGCRWLRELPRSLKLLQSLQELGVKDCKSLRRLPDSFGQLGKLKKLQVVQCPGSTFPNCFDTLPLLEDLYINLKLRALPKSFASMPSLRTLYLRGFRMQVFPEIVNKLEGLQSLTICGWPKLEGVGESLSQLVSLRKLMICCCPRLRALPRAILQMPNLSRGCRELLALEFDLPWLQPDDVELTHNCDWLQ